MAVSLNAKIIRSKQWVNVAKDGISEPFCYMILISLDVIAISSVDDIFITSNIVAISNDYVSAGGESGKKQKC